MFIILIMLYITSLILITGSLYLLTVLNQFPLPPPLHLVTADLIFFYEFVWFWSIIDLQYNISSWYTIQWFDISRHFKMITMVSLVVICHHTKILHNYWLYSPHCTLHTCDSLILQLEVCTSYLSHLFLSSPNPSSNHLFVLCIYDCFCFVMFVHLFCF